MNTPNENNILTSCQYTPVYIIENPGADTGTPISTTTSSFKTQASNLKAFYESSGKLENNLLQSTETTGSQVSKKDNGNNLKLANFLLPKNNVKLKTVYEHQSAPFNKIILKPMYVANTISTSNQTPVSAPKFDVCSKIVRLKDIPTSTQRNRKILPKIIPKDELVNPAKTSVQIVKLGETYHCLNKLNDDQVKVVNKALKIFNGPKNTPKEPTYEATPDTQMVYKVLLPKDVSGFKKSKVIIKPKKPEFKKEISKRQEKKEIVVPETKEPETDILEEKVTRSGRKVKLPKNILPEETLQKPKKKSGTIVTCFQCSLEFNSLYRLQRHYELHPTHIPTQIHTDLFNCLLAIIKTGSEENRAHIFLQQLEQLIAKIKSVIPCLVKNNNLNGKLSTISEDIGILLGISPGEYNLNADALSCVKDNNGHCEHNPPPLTSCLEQVDNASEAVSLQTDPCIDMNSTELWPTVNKRSECHSTPEYNSAKKIKLGDSELPVILDDDDIDAFFSNNLKTDILENKTTSDETQISDQLKDTTINQNAPKTYVKFHSAHFDIRSSPIKPSSTEFTKFQINPEKLPKFDIQEIRPLLPQVDEEKKVVDHKINENNTQNGTNHLFPSKDSSELNLDTFKEWPLNYLVNTNTDSYNIKGGILSDATEPSASIEPTLIHIKDHQLPEIANRAPENSLIELPLVNHESVLNLLSYPETSISNNSIEFPIDLFTFNNA
ncbi:unnamed protein product [Leptosia nina]|uniref:C2H2-type domain-containing protein n=1 Tax=Leptosia nina TaxID=320188 RepID=A0AAV1J5H6_9NEOP